jgi:hypothetical protein
MEVHSIHERRWRRPRDDGGHALKDLGWQHGDVHGPGPMVVQSDDVVEGKTIQLEGVEDERRAMLARRSDKEDTSYTRSSRSASGLSVGSRARVLSSAPGSGSEATYDLGIDEENERQLGIFGGGTQRD